MFITFSGKEVKNLSYSHVHLSVSCRVGDLASSQISWFITTLTYTGSRIPVYVGNSWTSYRGTVWSANALCRILPLFRIHGRSPRQSAQSIALLSRHGTDSAIFQPPQFNAPRAVMHCDKQSDEQIPRFYKSRYRIPVLTYLHYLQWLY